MVSHCKPCFNPIFHWDACSPIFQKKFIRQFMSIVNLSASTASESRSKIGYLNVEFSKWLPYPQAESHSQSITFLRQPHPPILNQQDSDFRVLLYFFGFYCKDRPIPTRKEFAAPILEVCLHWNCELRISQIRGISKVHERIISLPF